MDDAVEHYRKGDLNRARAEFEAIHAANPNDLSAAILLGFTYNKLDRAVDALNLLAPLEPGNETNLDLEYALAFAMIQAGKQSEGVVRMEKVAAAKNSGDAWLLAGSTRFYRNEMSLARVDLNNAVELVPTLPGVYTLAGQARFAMKDMPGATEAFQAALRADPMDFVANRDLGAIRRIEGNYEAARTLLEFALQLHPGDQLTRLELAKVYDATGRVAEALHILEDLEKTDSDWLDLHWVLASVYGELNRPEDSKRERALARKLQNNPNAAPPHRN